MSSEALERLRGDLERGKPSRCTQWVLVSREDCLALLAEVARLEQERDTARTAHDRALTETTALSVREGLISPVQKVLQLRDALAVARERDQRAVDALRKIADGNWNFGNAKPGLSVTQFARAALVDEPAAAVTHGRHCPCSACAREDWTRITGPCGMHGADCPAEYAPASAAADEPGETPA